ncbi:MAG: carbohydrate-binding protein [Planctomycetota bacterium]
MIRDVNKLSALAAATALAAAGTALAQSDIPGWRYIWSDEFDGTSLNPSNWEPMFGDGSAYGIPGWGNNELQWYTDRPENIQVSDGSLKIIALDDGFGNRAYSSARLRSINLADFRYGRFEGRIKVPSATGMWPAFWMLPTGNVYGGWAASGEIDILETRNVATRVGGTIHFGGASPANTFFGGEYEPGVDLGASFHEYAIEWEPDTIRWFLDGVQYFVATSNNWYSNGSSLSQAPFNQPFHMLLNVAIGGNYPGTGPDASTTWPQMMEVDYVRVFESVQEPFSGLPASIPGRIEAENFDLGYESLAYNDQEAGNNGGAYRPATGVDIEASAEGGFNVGWLALGDWMEYTVDVQTPGAYALTARVASPTGNGAFRLLSDQTDLTGEVPVPATGGWQAWTDVSTQIELSTGEQILRFEVDGLSERFNFNYIDLQLIQATGCSIADLTTSGATLPGQPGFGTPDGVVTLDDLGYYLNIWLPGDIAADTTTTGATLAGQAGFGIPDGAVDLDDLGFYLGYWLAGCN